MSTCRPPWSRLKKIGFTHPCALSLVLRYLRSSLPASTPIGTASVSEAEGQAYAHQVLRDLSLTLDGHPLAPRLVSANFPAVQEMKEGLGEIRIEFIADLPRGGINRKLIIENRHQSRISAYLVNCLLPHDRDIRVIAQDRNANQSLYQLNYIQANGSAKPLPSRWRSRAGDSLNALGGFESMFRLGMRHIAEGTDHLLFLLALL